jgi:hypothetical protein
MTVESAADRAVFVNTDDFGVAATYTKAAGGASTVNGIFDNNFVEVTVDTGVPIASTTPGFTMRTADLPSGYAPGDTIAISGTTYNVRVVKNDGTGITVLVLETQ